jgi:hypothetical protein
MLWPACVIVLICGGLTTDLREKELAPGDVPGHVDLPIGDRHGLLYPIRRPRDGRPPSPGRCGRLDLCLHDVLQSRRRRTLLISRVLPPPSPPVLLASG